jgi:tetraacyldisaccharide 4'-kinase
MKFKKPKFWDLKKSNLLSFLLLPFTLPILINNFFLNFKSNDKNKKVKTICVGNIYVGGTGKTPTTIALYNILRELKINVVTGKKTYASQIDEGIILKEKTETINKKTRKKIIEHAINDQRNVVIFDDGLQDKSISYNLQFVCFDTETFVGNGLLIPSGPLREKLNSLKKYDCVFLKSDGVAPQAQLDSIKKYNPNIRIFKTYFKICNLDKFNLSQNYLIFSGIGNSQSFKNILIKNGFKIIEELIFPDHYNYKKDDINDILDHARNINAEIITTEKDFVKISKFNLNKIKFIEIRLEIENKNNLIDFLKIKIHE